MWMAILKPCISGKYSQKHKKQPTESQKTAKTEYKLSGGPVLHLACRRWGRFSPLVTRQLHQGVGKRFRTADRFRLALFCGPALNKIMNVWHMQICYNSQLNMALKTDS